MRPAKYAFSAQRNGFQGPQWASTDGRQTTFTLNAGEHRTNFTIEMTPEAVITGRVFDEQGDPVENVFVRATPTKSASRGPIGLDRMYAGTNERGEFRIVGIPGKFYVSVDSGPARPGPREIRSDGTEKTLYGKTWHPAAQSEDRAVPVEAIAGRETVGIDVHLNAKRSLTISGVVTGTPAGEVRAGVFLSTKYYNLESVKPDSEGRFTLSGLAPDKYTVRARYGDGDGRLISGAVEVRLDGTDQSGVTLRLARGEEVSGNVETDSDRIHAEQKWKVNLSPLVPEWVEAKGGDVDREGSFHIAPVYPGKFRLRVESLPENAFVKTVRVNGTPSTGDAIDLSGGVAGAKLNIIIGLNGGQIEGTVSVYGGDNSSGGATVVLADALDDIGSGRRVGVEAGKKYKFAGLRPGKYRFIVLDSRQEFSEDTLTALFPKAPEIEIHEGDRITRDVHLAPREKPSVNR
jgi:hypothetical protein